MVEKRWKKVEGIYHQNKEFIKRKELAHLANPFIHTGGSDPVILDGTTFPSQARDALTK